MTTSFTSSAGDAAPRPAIAAPAAYLVRDPICGMEFNPAGAAATRTTDGETVYFCSRGCRDEFLAGRGPVPAAPEPRTAQPVALS